MPEASQVFPKLFKDNQLAVLLAYKEAKALLNLPPSGSTK
jgi:hypothetical protein